jgi:hypothetical protein
MSGTNEHQSKREKSMNKKGEGERAEEQEPEIQKRAEERAEEKGGK